MGWSLTVTRVNHSGTYYLTDPFSRRLEGAVNGDQLRPWFMRSSMRPEVQSSPEIQQQLHVFLERHDLASESVRDDV